jgi:sulfoacetaldehyde dehydrogenase
MNAITDNVETEVSALLENARTAQAHIEHYSQQQVNELVTAVCWAIVQPEYAQQLAKLAVDEGGFGNYADKFTKIRNRCMGTLLDMQNLKTVGIVEEIPEQGLIKIAKPVGVVAALIPVTGPDATPPYSVC